MAPMPTAPQLAESGVTSSASKVQGEGALQRIQSDIQRYMDGKISAQNAPLFQAPKWQSFKASFHCHDVVIHKCDDVVVTLIRRRMSIQVQSKQRLGALLQRQKEQPRAPPKAHAAPAQASEAGIAAQPVLTSSEAVHGRTPPADTRPVAVDVFAATR
jgi:hypothetical protein